jgi:hypothetical protein
MGKPYKKTCHFRHFPSQTPTQTRFGAAFAFLSIPRRGASSLSRFSSIIIKQIILKVLNVSIDQFRSWAPLHMEGGTRIKLNNSIEAHDEYLDQRIHICRGTKNSNTGPCHAEVVFIALPVATRSKTSQYIRQRYNCNYESMETAQD